MNEEIDMVCSLIGTLNTTPKEDVDDIDMVCSLIGTLNTKDKEEINQEEQNWNNLLHLQYEIKKLLYLPDYSQLNKINCFIQTYSLQNIKVLLTPSNKKTLEILNNIILQNDYYYNNIKHFYDTTVWEESKIVDDFEFLTKYNIDFDLSYLNSITSKNVIIISYYLSKTLQLYEYIYNYITNSSY